MAHGRTWEHLTLAAPTSPSEPTSKQPEEHRSPKPGGNCALSRLFPGLSQVTHWPSCDAQGESNGASLCPFWTGDVVHLVGSRGRSILELQNTYCGMAGNQRMGKKVSKTGKRMEVIFEHKKAQGTERHSDI